MTRSSGEFGYTLWGRDFRRLVEPTQVTKPEPLLPRARTLARSALHDVVVEGSLVRGTIVRGGEASVAYLEFGRLSRATATRIADAVGRSPTAVTLSDEIHWRIAPERPRLVSVDCSCRAHTDRCVHVLALMYETVRRIDENPVLALTLRGFHDALGVDSRDDADSGNVVDQWIPLTALDPEYFYR